jgi:hypothetical protein
MPPATNYDHKKTVNYLPKVHKTKGLTNAQIEIFKALEKKYVHEGRAVDSSFYEGTQLREQLAAIRFDSLLDIDEPIIPRFILEFYASVGLSSSDEGYLSLHFTLNGNLVNIPLDQFGEVLGIPSQGTCIYSDKWSLTILDSNLDRTAPYATPLQSKEVIREHLFIPKNNPTRMYRGREVARDPFAMELNELRPEFKKMEDVLRANVMCTIGNRDHINACLCHMMYNISTRQPFNLAYYVAKRMCDIPVQSKIAMPYGMLLTRLYRAFAPARPNHLGFVPDYNEIEHTFVPLSDFRVSVDKGKRPRVPTSSSSSSMSEDDGMPNSRIPPPEYLSHLPPIQHESAEYRNIKGMVKNLGRWMMKLHKGMKKLKKKLS